MSDEKASYGEVRGQLTEAEAVAAALRKGQADAVITERNVLLLRLKDAEEEAKKLLKAVETTKEAISLLSPDLAITYVNNAMCNLFGYKPQEMIGKHVSTLNAGPCPKVTAKQIASTIEKQGWWEGEVINKRKDGTEFISYATVSEVKNEGGEITSFISTQHDVTERKRAEETLKSIKKELTIRNKIAEIFLTIPDEQMFGEVLQVILEAMESKFGIFGYIDERGVLIIPSMTTEIWEKCQIPDKTTVYPPEKWGGIWGRALIEKRSLFANEGLHVPEGHIPITRVLVVPIIYAVQVIGLLEVANKPVDYSNKDQEFLETIAGNIAPILNARLQRDREERERKQTEEALRQARNELEQRVKERTSELDEANEQLIQKIEELQRTEVTLRESESALLKSQDNLRFMAGKLLSIQEEERRLLAREMHDDLTQRLALLSIEAGMLEQQLESSPKPLRNKLRQMKEQMVKLSAGVHDISRQLHPAILDDLGLVDAIKSECASFTKREGISVKFEPINIPEVIPKDAALCIYRIMQESLRNIAKHARVEEAEILLTGTDNGIQLCVKDNGIGFEPADIQGKGGLGLASMEERVRLIQGQFSIQSQPGQGTTVEIRAPLSRRLK